MSPVIDASLFYPETPQLASVRTHKGDEGIVVGVGAAFVPANVLSFNHVATPFLYDTINLHGHYELVQSLDGGLPEYYGAFSITDIAALNVLGVTEVVRGIADPWVLGPDTRTVTSQARPGITSARAPIRPASTAATVGRRRSSSRARGKGPRRSRATSRSGTRRGSRSPGSTSGWPTSRSTAPPRPPSSGACVSASSVDHAVAYVAASPVRALSAPAFDGPCPRATTGTQWLSASTGRAQANRYGGRDYRITGGDGAPGIVWAPENFYCPWRATVDGHAATCSGSTARSSASRSRPAGTVRFEFVPRDVQLGLLISMLTIGGLAGFWLFDRLRERARRSGDDAADALVDDRRTGQRTDRSARDGTARPRERRLGNLGPRAAPDHPDAGRPGSSGPGRARRTG